MRNKYALLCEVCAPKDKDYVTPAIGVVTGLCQICGGVVGASGCGYEWVPIAIARDRAAKLGLKFTEYGDGYTVTNGMVHPDGVTQIHPDSVELIHEFHDFPGVCTRVHVRPPKPGAVLVGANMMMLGDKNVTRAFVVWKLDPKPSKGGA